MIEVNLKNKPPLEPEFVPGVLWNRAYLALAAKDASSRDVTVRVSRPDGTSWEYATRLLPDESRYAEASNYYVERLIKFLLWARGGNQVTIYGAPDVAAYIKKVYAPKGAREFDYHFMGETCFLTPFQVASADAAEAPAPVQQAAPTHRGLDGCRIGFDLGGSDRKCAALIEGEVVFSEEVKWDPYYKSDPNYHIAGIQDSLERAAKHLPRVDAIGGSAAGLYINNEPRAGSLFRGISKEDFAKSIQPLFHNLQKEWGDVPMVIANDGDVTALAGKMTLGADALLGIAMGTSLAAGYIDRSGSITGWLNELAFTPVDYRLNAAVDEWSGDVGCGAQYFSQQAVGRLIPVAGLSMSDELPLPEKLEAVQEKMQQGDERAAAIYQTIGAYFGYTIAQYADFYDFGHLLFLGRVSSGEGGRIIQECAEDVLKNEFPVLADNHKICVPDEAMKRHGQAIAAASLPTFNQT